MFSKAALLLMGAGAEIGGAGPDGPPTNASNYLYSGTLYGVQWTAGDVDAETEVYFIDTLGVGCPSTFPDDFTLLTTRAAGLTSYDAGQSVGCTFYLRHKKNGLYSAVVQVTAGDSECIACPDIG